MNDRVINLMDALEKSLKQHAPKDPEPRRKPS